VSVRTEDIVLLAWNDLVGMTRVRGVPRSQIERRMAHGLGWALAGQALTPFEDIAPNPWGPVGEVRQVPDPATETRLDLDLETPALHFMLCDSLNPDGTPWACCTRSFLKAALADLEKETGLRLRAAFEQELHLSGPGFVAGPPFSMEAIRQGARFAGAAVAALRLAGVEPETFEPEYGVAQFEYACPPVEGVAAADRALIAREAVREAARRLGLRASFTPKATPGGVGNGLHIHVSLWDRAGRPMTYDAARPAQLSEVAGHFAAGVVRHARALVALTAPSPVSYLRLGPHHWSSGYTAFGVQNRECALRVCPPPDKDEAARARHINLEYRPADATASPYLALGALVRAGLEGVRARLPMPQPTEGDPHELSADARRERGVHPLPTTLAEALVALEGDAVARGWFADEMLTTYLAVKRTEIAAFQDVDAAAMCERYRLAY